MNSSKCKEEIVSLTIQFSNSKALEHFAIWLCEQGEQSYWDWMECQEEKEPGEITATSFDYHNGTEEFLKDKTIRTDCGRLQRKRIYMTAEEALAMLEARKNL